MLTIWTNADLAGDALAALREGTAGHRLLFAGDATTNLAASGENELLTQADVAFGQPDPRQAMDLESLRWVHLTSAGYTRYDFPEFFEAVKGRAATLTNSSSVYDEPCAQHMLAFMLASVRQLPQALISQRDGHVWAYAKLRPVTRILSDQTVLLLGFGAIGRRVAELLAPFHVKVVAVRRTVRGDEPVETFTMDAMDELLPFADHVVNVLPAASSTNGLLNAARFRLMKPGAGVYNVGRGTTIDQNALIDALIAGRLSAAYLDVTDPEPLPSDHPLWAAPNCFITPHVAGGMQNEMLALVRHFLVNLRRFEAGEPLTDRII